MFCAVSGVMLALALLHVGRHADIVAVVGAFQDVAGPALRLADQGFARSGHSACGGMAERVGFEPTSRFLENTLSKRAPSATRTPLLWASAAQLTDQYNR